MARGGPGHWLWLGRQFPSITETFIMENKISAGSLAGKPTHSGGHPTVVSLPPGPRESRPAAPPPSPRPVTAASPVNRATFLPAGRRGEQPGRTHARRSQPALGSQSKRTGLCRACAARCSHPDPGPGRCHHSSWTTHQS